MRCLILGGTGMLGPRWWPRRASRGWAALGLSRAQADVTDRDRPPRLGGALPARRWWSTAPPTPRSTPAETERGAGVRGQRRGGGRRRRRWPNGRERGWSTSRPTTSSTARPSEPYREDAPDGAALGLRRRASSKGSAGRSPTTAPLVVRTSWLFGPGGPNFVAAMVGLIEAGRLPLRVVRGPGGVPHLRRRSSPARCSTSRRWEATGIVHYQQPGAGLLVRFRGRDRPPWSGAVEVVPVTTAEFPRPAPRPAYSVLDVGALRDICRPARGALGMGPGRNAGARHRGIAASRKVRNR